MSKRYYARHNKQVVILADTPFAGGGEGQIYKVTVPKRQNWVAKIYHPSKRSVEREEKMAYLQQHPPHTQEEQGAWIIDVLEDKKGRFLGILMPFQRGEKLEVLCGVKLPRFIKKTWQAWGLESPTALESRFHLGLQLAAVVAQLHDSQHYVLVDLKPDNILVEANRHLALVDLDSVAVIDQGNLRFAAPMATPEYAPPEYHQDSPALLPSWDNFSLAVILYKLFCGIHPYAATANAPYEQMNSLGQKIKQGLFVHKPSNAPFLRVIPPPHERFKALPNSLQALFLQCFEGGHEYPEKRPTASVWCWALLDVVGDAALVHQFRELLVDGWDRPRQPLLLPSHLLLKEEKKENKGAITGPTKLLSSTVYERGSTLLEELENSNKDSRRIQVLFLIGAVFCLVILLALVVVYTPAVQAILVFSMAYIIRTLVGFYRYRKQKNPLKKALCSYQEKQEATTKKWKELVQLWEGKKDKQILHVSTTLERVATRVKGKDKLVHQFLQERLKVYEQVVEQYQEKLKALELPKAWLDRPWTTIIQLLEWQQVNQEELVECAVRESAPQEAYEQALEQAIGQLQQAEEQLLGEARGLFDWAAFFDTTETGLAWGEQTLFNLLEVQKVPNLLAVEELTWTAAGDLELQFGGQVLLLEKQAHQQLELFYEVYQWYQESMEFARAQQLSTALDFLRARFSALQQEHQEQLNVLAVAHQVQQAAASMPYQAALQRTKEQLEGIEVLKKERETALLQVEEDYQDLYKSVQEEIEEELESRRKLLASLKEDAERYWEELQQENSFITLQKQLAIENQKIEQLL
ncbi:MAG: protein kinase domain-containing protein [Aureispira sp.]